MPGLASLGKSYFKKMKNYIMVKITVGIIVTGLLLFASCRYPDPHSAGSLTFKSKTYNIKECQSTGSIVFAIFDVSDSNAGIISCTFDSSALPLSSGTYIAGQAPNLNHQLVVYLNTGGTKNNYASTGGNGTEKINLTVKDGKINLSGTGIEMVSQTTDADSAALDLNFTQNK
jgi:hypothetical protein